MAAAAAAGAPEAVGPSRGDTPDMSQYQFYIRTVNCSELKAIFECLREMVSDANLKVTPSAMRFVVMDPSSVALTYVRLDADKFDTYYCERELVVGLSLVKLHPLIRPITNNDVLSIYIEKSDPNRLAIMIQNKDKRSLTIKKINTLDINSDDITFPQSDYEYDSIITMPSTDFQRLMRDLREISNIVEIRSMKNTLYFYSKGPFTEQSTVLGDSEEDGGITFRSGGGNRGRDDFVQGFYGLRYLVLFSKCASISQVVQLYMRSDFPLILGYSTGLGTIQMCLAPSQPDTDN